MNVKHLDLIPPLVGIPTNELNEQASDIWHLITEHNAKKATVYHYNTGELHIAILPSDDELIHFAFACRNSGLLDVLIQFTKNASGKLYCSSLAEYRKVQFEFR